MLAQKVIDIAKARLKRMHHFAISLFRYEALLENSIVQPQELEILSAWIKDINRLNNT